MEPELIKCSYGKCNNKGKSVAIFCSKCFIAKYCSKDCRKLHKKNHRKSCKKTSEPIKVDKYEGSDAEMFLYWNCVNPVVHNTIVSEIFAIIDTVKKLLEKDNECDVVICMRAQKLLITNEGTRSIYPFLDDYIDEDEVELAKRLCDRTKCVVIVICTKTGERYYRKLDFPRLLDLEEDHDKPLRELDLDKYVEILKTGVDPNGPNFSLVKKIHSRSQLKFNYDVVFKPRFQPVIVSDLDPMRNLEVFYELEHINTKDPRNELKMRRIARLFEIHEPRGIIVAKENGDLCFGCFYSVGSDRDHMPILKVGFSFANVSVMTTLGSRVMMDMITKKAKEFSCVLVCTQITPTISNLDFCLQGGFCADPENPELTNIFKTMISIFKTGFSNAELWSSLCFKSLILSPRVVYKDRMIEMYKVIE